MRLDLSFMPRMQSEAHGFTVVGAVQWRSWAGVVADVWRVECAPQARGDYTSPDARLFVVLDLPDGGTLELRSETGELVRHRQALSMSYIPAGLRVTSRAVGIGNLKHLDLHLPEGALTRRLGKGLREHDLATARLELIDARVAGLARLIADECESPSPLGDRYGEGLVDALLAALFQVKVRDPKSRPSLSRAQLKMCLDFIEAHAFETIRLHDLATQLGLSESYVSHAFKASTGVPPLRWQMEVRIGKVKEMLGGGANLTEIAATAGFSDQAHLTRTFKRFVGTTPADWRRSRQI